MNTRKLNNKIKNLTLALLTQSKIIKDTKLLVLKLNYLRDIFKNFNLSQAQRVRILEQFDRAKTHRLAKLIFSTIKLSYKQKVSSNSNKPTLKHIFDRTIKSTKPTIDEAYDRGNLDDDVSVQRVRLMFKSRIS